jgi:Viral BACON domain/Putative binding domain, N-terminal
VHRRRRAALFIPGIAIALVAAFAAQAHAQTINPTTAEFVPSPDHSATLPDGTAALTRYDLEFYNAGAASPFQSVSLGKPTPGTGGVIRVLLTSVLTSLPSPGIMYEARVAAVGPGGMSRSTASNTFSFTSPCSFSISPTTQTIVPGGGTGSVAVTAGTGCAWTAVSNASWISITAGGSGTGNGAVNYSVAADATGSNRTGTLTIAGGTVTISQSACSFAVSPTSVNLTSGGGTGAITVTATAGCPWSSTSGATWLTITSGASGTGPGSVAFSATATSSARSANLTIAGRSVTVTQGAVPAPPSNVHILTTP